MSDETESEPLPDLTPSQAKFVERLAAGDTASDAYRAAYGCLGWQSNTIWARASELRRNSKVRAWLDAAREAQADTINLTKDQHLRDLERMKDRCEASGDLKGAIRCLELAGRASGLYTERVQHIESDDPAVLEAELNKLRAERGAEPQETRH